MVRVLGGCPDQPLPGADDAAGPAADRRTAPAPAADPAPLPGGAFENCAAARAAGAAPVHRGDPGYGAEPRRGRRRGRLRVGPLSRRRRWARNDPRSTAPSRRPRPAPRRRPAPVGDGPAGDVEGMAEDADAVPGR